MRLYQPPHDTTGMTRQGRTAVLCFALCMCSSWAFSARSTFAGGGLQRLRLQHAAACASSRIQSSSRLLVMRDASASYWFEKGDAIKVVDDVIKAGENLRGRQGFVIQTWEKCDVDPTCCCAEQVDLGMAVRAEFQGSERSDQDEGSFYHYFAEDELLKQEKVTIEDVSDSSQVAFDGMSCMAFKLDQLQLDKKPRGIASFDPQAESDSSDSS